MIVVLDYNKSRTDYLDEIFKENDTKYIYSMSEAYITVADKIILPPPIRLKSCYRKMNIRNLFSILKLLDKPILGINDGFHIMCNYIKKINGIGLGFFDVDWRDDSKINIEEKFVDGKIKVVKDSKLFLDRLDGNKLIFNINRQPPLCSQTSSSVIYNEKEYSFTYEVNNYYGVEIDIERNKDIVIELLKNFINI